MPDHAPGSALALALAILGLVLAAFPPLGLPLSAIAFALAWRARRLVRAAPGRWRDSQLPIAAQVVALVAMGLAVIAGAAWLALMLAAAPSAEPPLRF